MNPSSPQAKEMADDSMVRNLAAQAEATWPRSRFSPAIRSQTGARVLDVALWDR
jgi:hypothetical protein